LGRFECRISDKRDHSSELERWNYSMRAAAEKSEVSELSDGKKPSRLKN